MEIDMTEDSLFIGFVSAVWGLLWALYAFVPMFSMPVSGQLKCRPVWLARSKCCERTPHSAQGVEADDS